MTDLPVRDDRTRTKRLLLTAASFLALVLAMTSSIGPVSPDNRALAMVQPQTQLQATARASPTALLALGDPGTAKTPSMKDRVASGSASRAGSAPAASAPSVPLPSPSPPPPPPPGGPIRAAFYYPWYPENWHQGNPDPWTHYHPSLGGYNSSDPALIKAHIAAMQYGGIQAGIASWWGQGSPTDQRIPTLLQAAHGTSFSWSLYYEPALNAATVRADLTYILNTFGGDPNYLHVHGKPVLFVYARALTNCADVATWVTSNPGFYLNLAWGGDFSKCTAWPDAFHVYSPVIRLSAAKPYSATISPGFWQANEATPRLARDVAAFAQACQAMVQSRAQWQLVATFNEFGEGTSIEASAEYASPSGYGAYLDALHNC